MNICLISREFPPFHGGGIGTYTLQWARALASQGHCPVVVTVSDDGQQVREEADRIVVVRLPFIRGTDWSRPDPAISTPETEAAFRSFSPVAAFAMRVAQQVPELNAEFAFDAVEVPETGALAWFLLNARRTRGHWHDAAVPIVTMLHSPSEWIALWNRAPLSTRQERTLAEMERESVMLSDGLVCPTDSLAEWCARHWSLPHRAVEVIPHALGALAAEPSGFVGSAGAASALTDEHSSAANGSMRFLFVGRLEPRKGIDTLLRAFVIASARVPGIELDLVGEDTWHAEADGPFGAWCAARDVPEALRPRVRLHGKVSPDRLATMRREARAVLVPSPTDNFPYACVEAMAQGRLVVAARAGGMAEMIRENVEGVMFTPGDPELAAAALYRTAKMTSEAVERMGLAAAARIRDLCDNARVVARRIDHFERARARRLAQLGRSLSQRAVVVVNAPAESPPGFDRLVETVALGEAEFAHGWTRPDPGLACAFGPPNVESLAVAPRTLGPLVVSAESATLLGAELRATTGAASSESPGPISYAQAGSTWALAVRLCAAGRSGVVVPEVVSEVAAVGLDSAEVEVARVPVRRELAAVAAARDTARAELAGAREELATIHRSRGWRWLQRVYRVLRVVREIGSKSETKR
ncbi:MAG: glycosyltransferase family 4 protein [Phycisphaerales bacterium]